MTAPPDPRLKPFIEIMAQWIADEVRRDLAQEQAPPAEEQDKEAERD